MNHAGCSSAAISLGANLGNRLQTLRAAVSDLAALPHTALQKASSVWETTPVGYLDQPVFLNAAVILSTSLAPNELFTSLQELEAKYFRVRKFKNGPRTLDLDLLYVDQLIMADKQLTLPHPRLHERAFVLAPLCEIAPHWQHPLLGATVQELWRQLNDQGGVAKCRESLVES